MTDINTNAPPEQEPKKELPIKMLATTIIMAVVLVFLIIMYFYQRHNMIEMETILTEEKDSLTNELELMIVAYDTLRTNNDSLNADLEKERMRIVQLLSINASNTQLVRKYKREITTMREIMKSYIVQIDSLNSRNKILVAENSEIRHQITQVRNTNTQLSIVKKNLSSKVEIASVIRAKDVVAVPLNRKRKETSRVSLLNKLRVCFTLRENPLAQAGTKEVFMRVIRPDSLVITNSPDNLFDYNDGKTIYSASREVDYMNQDIEMCIYLDNTGDFIIGNYSVELFLENNLIGRTNFMFSSR